MHGVRVSIPGGQFVSVIGRSAAGKSTLPRMINRLAGPTSGRISWRGTGITALWAAPCILELLRTVPDIVLAMILVVPGGGRPAMTGNSWRDHADIRQPGAVLYIERALGNDHRDCGSGALYLSETIRVLEWQEAGFLIPLVLITVATIDPVSRRLRVAIIGANI